MRLLLAKTRDATGMQLRIVDRPAFLVDAIGTEAAVCVQCRLITLAVAHILLRRPSVWPIAGINLRTIGNCHGPARSHLRASGRHARDRRQECGREGQARDNLVACHVSALSLSPRVNGE